MAGCITSSANQFTQPIQISIEAYFNQFNGEPLAFEDVVWGLIEDAEISIDVALYHISLPSLMNLLNVRCEQGIRIRVMTEFDADLSSQFGDCIELAFERNPRLMHHKFMIVDEAVVWTSSANWTETSFGLDTNNAVVIESREVARAFALEFQEMFERQNFGADKADSNRELFTGQELVEVYFSPTDSPRRRLLELIHNAKHSIDLAVYAMTDRDIFEALEAAKARGVKIKALWDFAFQSGCQFSEADEWTKQGVGIVEALPGLLHHKFAVIDGEIVITGSANWSFSGMERNDENLVIIHSQGLAASYQSQFDEIERNSLEHINDPLSPPRLEARHFEFSVQGALIQWRPHELGVVDSYEICRSTANDPEVCDQTWEIPGWMWYWIDRTAAPGTTYHYRVRAHSRSGSSRYSDPVILSRSTEGQITLDVISVLEDLETYIGQDVVVEHLVTEAFVSSAGNLFLNSGTDHETDYTTFVPACAIERFTGSGLDLFGLEGKKIRVAGELIEFNGPEIVVTGPWQIEIIK